MSISKSVQNAIEQRAANCLLNIDELQEWGKGINQRADYRYFLRLEQLDTDRHFIEFQGLCRTFVVNWVGEFGNADNATQMQERKHPSATGPNYKVKHVNGMEADLYSQIIKAICRGELLMYDLYMRAIDIQDIEPATAPLPTSTPQAAPVSETVTPTEAPALRQQEEKIMEWLRENGHDAKSLPARKNGHKTVKATAKAALDENAPFVGKTTFNKAWERLRAGNEIQEDVTK